ncbi:MAG: zinc-binding alcohol dehydrogenase family protein [Cyclobacteriaceae bacterium]
MKALQCTSPGRLEMQEVDKPTLQKDYALLRILRIGICGTDLHAFEGTQPYFSYPRILGHELAAELVDIDGSSEFQRGELVTFIPYFNCGSCPMCKAGRTNCCQNLKVCGVHIDGGMTEYLLVPTKFLIKVKRLRVDEIALIEPLAIAMHAIRRANVQPGEQVVVAGAGPIGFGVIEYARSQGAFVTVIDVNEDRLAFCRDTLKINQIIHATHVDAFETLRDLTHGQMADVVFDATGNLQALQNGFRYMSHGSRYVLVGLQLREISFSHPEFHKREGTLMSSRNATRSDFESVIQSIEERRIDPLKMISHHVKFDVVSESFPVWLNPKSKTLKAIVELD